MELGSGMKSKTAEALMYGKPILGTKEAFEGYDTDPAKVGALCNTATEFIETIGKIQQDYDWIEQHGIYARKEYKTRYDYKISLNEFRSFMRKIYIRMGCFLVLKIKFGKATYFAYFYKQFVD